MTLQLMFYSNSNLTVNKAPDPTEMNKTKQLDNFYFQNLML